MNPDPILSARINLEVKQEAYNKALRLSQTKKQHELWPKLKAAKMAMLKAELEEKNGFAQNSQ